jgi:hypothetical protein
MEGCRGGKSFLGLSLVGLLLSGCSAPQRGRTADESVVGGREQRGSWMAPGASSSDLLYVTTGNDVDLLSYPGLSRVGTLVGFNGPKGECVDGAGNVWITSAYAGRVIEYPHGATSPIAVLNADDAVACTIDSSSGNLAVANESDAVQVFAHARTRPATYACPNAYLFNCAYDAAGNLFVEGQTLA